MTEKIIVQNLIRDISLDTVGKIYLTLQNVEADDTEQALEMLAKEKMSKLISESDSLDDQVFLEIIMSLGCLALFIPELTALEEYQDLENELSDRIFASQLNAILLKVLSVSEINKQKKPTFWNDLSQALLST